MELKKALYCMIKKLCRKTAILGDSFVIVIPRLQNVLSVPYLKLITIQFRFRNSMGATPVLFLNILLKCWGYLKPSS
jgi:hypothetical protein